MATAQQLANLRPAKLGEVRNPEGRNQYSYRRDFERAMARLAQGGVGLRTAPFEPGRSRSEPCGWCALPLAGRDDGVVVEELGPMHAACVARVRERTRGELLARLLWGKALRGEEWAAKLLAARLWPERLELVAPTTEERAGETAADRMAELPAELRESFERGVAGLLQAGQAPVVGPSTTDLRGRRR